MLLCHGLATSATNVTLVNSHQHVAPYNHKKVYHVYNLEPSVPSLPKYAYENTTINVYVLVSSTQACDTQRWLSK